MPCGAESHRLARFLEQRSRAGGVRASARGSEARSASRRVEQADAIARSALWPAARAIEGGDRRIVRDRPRRPAKRNERWRVEGDESASSPATNHVPGALRLDLMLHAFNLRDAVERSERISRAQTGLRGARRACFGTAGAVARNTTGCSRAKFTPARSSVPSPRRRRRRKPRASGGS